MADLLRKPKGFLFGGRTMPLANLFDLSELVAVVNGGMGGALPWA
jgi:hypothetical protein